ncbi:MULTISPECIES: arginine deiminase family protein [unclassified Dehalobacter]|uniref:arginine deiminase family protein n=1 Tax=unclassified Dehalobacter TaxID=2635733 RepID=UPI000E6B8E9B|nr:MULTISPECIES: arginine deiminase family protein [unclassified Dehalobacter]RJE47998.1 arginine deiminase [Dehalobacter sp. MCB1]TCX50594.1 arginine deiminase [Dehalobacter sp. 14DCB1]TCX52162.1 arginine deiminase [Dehalobacter sp. 12DCB1]
MLNHPELFGTEKLGRLRKVILHKPQQSLNLVNLTNYQECLFNFVPDIPRYQSEHQRYADLLRAQGIEVLELQDVVQKNKALLHSLPNLPYLNDTCLITSQGAILSKMCPGSRAGEETVVGEALDNLGIPLFHAFQGQDQFEGCLAISPEILFLADTQRHTRRTLEEFFSKVLHLFPQIIYAEIPQERRYMHPDMIFGRISESLALAYLPAFLKTYLITAKQRTEINVQEYLACREMEIIELSDQEQQSWGCSFVSVDANILIHYDIALSLQTQNELSRRGVEIIPFHPEALLAGGGSLRCLTLRVWRDSNLQLKTSQRVNQI